MPSLNDDEITTRGGTEAKLRSASADDADQDDQDSDADDADTDTSDADSDAVDPS